MADIGVLACMLKSNCANIALRIHIKNGIFVQIFRFGDVTDMELNIQCVGILEITDFHGMCLFATAGRR